MAQHIAVNMVRIYRGAVSPWLPAACRYEPSCSQYAEDALSKFGFWRGLSLTVLRICRCHPWGGSGVDPVPETFGSESR